MKTHHIIIAIAAIIVAAFVLVKCGGCGVDKPGKIDTAHHYTIVYEQVHDTVNGPPELIFIQKPSIKIIYDRDTLLIPSEDCPHLKRQYEGLIETHFTTNHFQRTYPVDTIGTVKITDTVSENMITGRSLVFDLNYPIITHTVTITKPLPLRRQLYIGTGISGSSKGVIDAGELSLLYRDRKERVYEVGGRYNIQMRNYSIEAKKYWKL